MTLLEDQVWIHDDSDSEDDGELIAAISSTPALPRKKRPRSPNSDSDSSACRTPSPPPLESEPPKKLYKKLRLSDGDIESKIREFVNAHGHLPRCRLKTGSAPFLANEKILGTAVAQMRTEDGWALPPWWPPGLIDDEWDNFVEFIQSTPSKQQLDSKQTVLNNIFEWVDAAVLIGRAPTTAIPSEIDPADTDKLAAWAKASRAQRLLSNVLGGQFYAALFEPALNYAEIRLGKCQPDLVTFLRERLQRSLLLRSDRVARRRVSRVARNEKARKEKREAADLPVAQHVL